MPNVRFTEANSKTKKLYKVAGLKKWLDRKIGKRKAKVYGFSLLAGVDCPFARRCQSRAIVKPNAKREIQDGPETRFRCFSATQEVQYDEVYLLRLQNHLAVHGLKTRWKIADAIEKAMPEDAGIIRIHISGDFFNNEYFMAWIIVASRFPNVLFYAYTKSLRYWVRNRDYLPENFVLTASRGGRDDRMISRYKLRSAKVCFSVEEAERYGLEIDDDDSTAADPTKKNDNFALLIHGTQPAKSKASMALTILQKQGIVGGPMNPNSRKKKVKV